MALVHIDLAELDKIRDDLNKAGIEIAKKNDLLTEKEKEIEAVKADKRTVRVVTKMIPKHSETFNYSVDGYLKLMRDYEYANHREMERKTYSISEEIIRMCRSSSSTYGLMERIQAVLMRYYSNNRPLTPEFTEHTTTEYVNYDDVLVQIRQELEAKVANELSGYKTQIHQLQGTITDMSNKEASKFKELTEDYDLKIENLTRRKDEQIAAIQKAFDDFKAEKDTRSLEQQVADLKAELELWKNKKWYQRTPKK